MPAANATRAEATWSERVLKTLEEFPGGAQARVLHEEMGLQTPVQRSNASQAMAYLANAGRIARTGNRGSYVYRLHDEDMPPLDARGQLSRRLGSNHPDVIAARIAADWLRPDLAKRLNQLADWATGEHVS